ncbi:unnamed protein product [Moneuplotes crassus]|uniref:Uncharacterized protein n=1 Tax=Euplotes crassus TaxID=5936 RepID=A0AAD2D9X2_EUPCR|nr:unnamed protein product [Moneuplotes crassus]
MGCRWDGRLGIGTLGIECFGCGGLGFCGVFWSRFDVFVVVEKPEVNDQRLSLKKALCDKIKTIDKIAKGKFKTTRNKTLNLIEKTLESPALECCNNKIPIQEIQHEKLPLNLSPRDLSILKDFTPDKPRTLKSSKKDALKSYFKSLKKCIRAQEQLSCQLEDTLATNKLQMGHTKISAEENQGQSLIPAELLNPRLQRNFNSKIKFWCNEERFNLPLNVKTQADFSKYHSVANQRFS